MEREEIGVGLVGYKFMGRAHSNAYRQVASFFETGAYLLTIKASRRSASCRLAALNTLRRSALASAWDTFGGR